MYANTSFDVANVQVSELPIHLNQIEGYFKGATASWLQLFDSATTPANGAVPLWQAPLYPTSQFAETLQVNNIVLTEGCFVGISTTEGTWTASAETMDITVFTDFPPVSTTIVGDLTSNTPGRVIWTDDVANNVNKLVRIQAKQSTGTDGFILVFAKSPSSGDVPLYALPLPSGNTIKEYFGVDGQYLFSVDLDGTIHYGCFVMASSTANVLTIATNYQIQATYV